MRLWHLIFAVFGAALVLTVAREEVGRVAIIVFATGMGLIVLATSSLMMLFRTVGAFGMSRSILGHVEAALATIGVLFFGTASIWAVLWCGLALMSRAVK